MKSYGRDVRKALIALSFGLEPVIFAIVGWYAAPYFELSNAVGALIGVFIGLGMMFWRIWRFTSTIESKPTYDIEKEDLRLLASIAEVERRKFVKREDLMKVMGSQSPLQLLNVLKGLSLINSDFYDLNKLNEVLCEITDFSKVFIEVRSRSPFDFLRILDDFNDFLACLCASYAFRSEVYDDEISRGYIVLPFKLQGSQTFLREEFKEYLAHNEVRELYPKALDEALTLNSRAPLLALAAHSLMNMARDLKATGYSRTFSKDLENLALRLLLIATRDIRGVKRTSEVVVMTLRKWRIDKIEVEGVDETEEGVLRSFINEAYKNLVTPVRVPPTAKSVIYYLFVKWGEKVSLKLAIMATNSGIEPQRAYSALLVPR
ncbi:MAG: hypothetical protein QW701_06645 [Candidatus Nezhaarchaeales archaeon]